MAAIAIVALGIVVVDHARRPGMSSELARLVILIGTTTAGPLAYSIQQAHRRRSATAAGVRAGALNGAVLWLAFLVYAIAHYGVRQLASTSYVIPVAAYALCAMVIAGMVWGCAIGFAVSISARKRERRLQFYEHMRYHEYNDPSRVDFEARGVAE